MTNLPQNSKGLSGDPGSTLGDPLISTSSFVLRLVATVSEQPKPDFFVDLLQRILL